MKIATATTVVTKVVDASAIASVILVEPDGAQVAARLAGARLAAPPLLSLELANTCLKRARREPERKAAFLAAFHLRTRFAIDEMPIDHDAVLDLAVRTGLTAYDASYLWLAGHLGAELVTLDRQLARAAQAL